MSIKPSLTIALATTTFLGTIIWSSSSHAQGITFVCTVDTDNVPTTYAQTPDGTAPIFKWTSTFFKPPYTPMQRCQEVSERMNNFSTQGQLDYLTSGQVNHLPVICAGNGCDPNGNNVLITLKPNQNPNQVLQEIESNRSGAGGPSYQLGSGSNSNHSRTSSLNQNADGTVTFNLKKYLNTSARTATPPSPNNTPGYIPSNSEQTRPASERVW